MSDLESVLAALRAGRRAPNGICDACLAFLPGLTGVGLVVMTGAGVRAPVCATDEVCGHMERLQFTLGEGPGMDAFRDAGPVLAADLAHADYVRRWPGFAREAELLGVRAMFAVPLQVGAIRVGVLEMYRETPGPLSEKEVADALLFAHAATVVLLDGYVDGHRDAGMAYGAGLVPYRAEVHQATGMVMAQLRVSLEEAFVRLRARAYAEGRAVEGVARDVVERRLRFDDGPGDPGRREG